jgi:hypothetical protein
MRNTLGRRSLGIATLLGALPLIGACHVCRTREVTARLAGQISVGGQSTQISLSGGASEATIGSQYERLERVVSDASWTAVAQSVIWTLESDAATGLIDSLAVQMPLPVQQGASLSMVLAGRMGGWGTAAPGPRPPLQGTPADVYVAKAGFVATSAEESILVVDASPLRLRIDLTFRGDGGRTVAIAGDVAFRVTDERDLCSFQ